MPQGPPPPYGPPPTNGLAIGGFVCGLLGFVLAWVPFVGFALSIVGLVLSVPGMGRARKVGAGTGLAVSGLVLSIIGLLAGVAFTIAVLSRVAEVDLEVPTEAEAENGAAPASTMLPTIGPLPSLDPVVETHDFALGECFTVSGTDIDVMPCAEEHQGEVFAEFEHPAPRGDAYPGRETLEEYADSRCNEVLPDLGAGASVPADLGLGFFIPLTDGWDAGERGITCFYQWLEDPRAGTVEEILG